MFFSTHVHIVLHIVFTCFSRVVKDKSSQVVLESHETQCQVVNASRVVNVNVRVKLSMRIRETDVMFVIEYHWYCDEAKIIRPSFELFDQW